MQRLINLGWFPWNLPILLLLWSITMTERHGRKDQVIMEKGEGSSLPQKSIGPLQEIGVRPLNFLKISGEGSLDLPYSYGDPLDPYIELGKPHKSPIKGCF